MGKRILGEDFSVSGGAGAIEVAAAKQEQTDLFGNTVNVKIKNKKGGTKDSDTSNGENKNNKQQDNSLDNELDNDGDELEGELGDEDLPVELVVNKNSANTPHNYKAVEGKENILALVKELLAQKKFVLIRKQRVLMPTM